MFGVFEAVSAFQWQLAVMEHEREAERLFLESIKGYTPEQQSLLIAQRQEIKQRLAKEAEIERRHRELCRAIRDSRPRGLGLFF